MHSINLNFIPESSGIYLVGGTVRDRLLGRPTVDYDIVAVVAPERIAERIAGGVGSRVVYMGKPGRETFRVVAGQTIYDVSPLRGRTIEEDLLKRDFTINAMAIETASGELFDPAGGRRDLARGVIRAVRPENFDADPLRMLRAFRFSAGLGFTINDGTLADIKRRATKIASAAGERVRVEWLQVLQAPCSLSRIQQMDQTGLLDVILPELAALKGCFPGQIASGPELFADSMATYGALERLLTENNPNLIGDRQNYSLLPPPIDNGLLKHAGLILNISGRCWDAPAQKQFIPPHPLDAKGASMAAGISRRLRFSKAENQYVTFLVAHHPAPLLLYGQYKKDMMDDLHQTRFFMHTTPFTPDLLMLALARHIGRPAAEVNNVLPFIRRTLGVYLHAFLPKFRKNPLLGGSDLLQEFGLRPSPLFATVLNHIEELRLAGKIDSREEALKSAEKFLEAQKHS